MSYIDKKELLDRTNGGLDIIRLYYPDAMPGKKFKGHAEKTASSNIIRKEDGTWIMTDFGDDGKGKDAITLVMEQQGLDFKEALDFVAQKFQISGSKVQSSKPLYEFEVREAVQEEEEGKYIWDLKAEISDDELKVIGPYVTREACKKYHLHSVKQYTYIKNRKAMIFKSTADYPIFLYDYGTWKKLYKPKEVKKEYRFLYEGKRPKDYIFGLAEVINEVKILKSKGDSEDREEGEDYGDEEDENTSRKKVKLTEDEKKEKQNDLIYGKYKLENVIMCSGDSDAINVASMGYWVIWLNSETASFTKEQYSQVMCYCQNLYYIPDIDNTGVRVANQLSLQYLDIKVIWLPEDLKTKKDFRGNDCKDLRDWIRQLSITNYELQDNSSQSTVDSPQGKETTEKVHAEGKVGAKIENAGNAEKIDSSQAVIINKDENKEIENQIDKGKGKTGREFVIQSFKRLLENAKSIKPWDEIELRDKTGKWIGTKYEFNNVRAYLFMYAAGFFLFESKNVKEGFIFINIKKNIVEIIEPVKVKKFVNTYLEKRHFKEGIRNMFYRSKQFAAANLLENLKAVQLDFKSYGKDYQFMFFKNKTWKITKNGIEEASLSAEKYVWDHKVIDHQVKLMKEKLFEINQVIVPQSTDDIILSTVHSPQKKNLEYRWEVKFKEDFPFIKYLWNASRIYWEKERDGIQLLINNEQITIEKSKNLTDEELIELGILSQLEVDEQRCHFVNKIYVIGYTLHRYKSPSRAWAPFAIDSREGYIGESNGGSGKSIFGNSFEHCISKEYLNGKDPKLTQNAHMLENVNEHTDLILIDDANRYTDLGYFFNIISGSTTINPKNQKSFTLSFDESPKIFFTSNHTPMNLDPSIERRLIFLVFSDYYHHKDLQGYYKEVFSPEIEFGKNFFRDWDEEEYSLYYNLMGQCLQFYLQQTEKINPPMTSAKQRILRSEMGEGFLDWAIVYFSDPEKLDRNIIKKDAINDYKIEANPQKFSPNSFKKKLASFCKYKGWELNPYSELTDKEAKRIIEKIDGKAEEMIHIKTGLIPEQGDIPF